MARRLLGLYFGNHELIVAINSVPVAEFALWREEFRLASSKRPLAAAIEGVASRAIYESTGAGRMILLEVDGGPAGALNAAVNMAQSPPAWRPWRFCVPGCRVSPRFRDGTC
jgi:hypothetical protein